MLILADWIAIGCVALFALIGCLVGFGKGLRFFTSGIFGIIISVIVCYFLFGILLAIPFLSEVFGVGGTLDVAILGDGSNGVLKMLVEEWHIGRIIFAVALFIVVQIIRKIIVAILGKVFEADNVISKFFNKIFGVILFVAMLGVFALIAGNIIAWIGGDLHVTLTEAFEGSTLKLDWLYANNPVALLMEHFVLPEVEPSAFAW